MPTMSQYMYMHMHVNELSDRVVCAYMYNVCHLSTNDSDFL